MAFSLPSSKYISFLTLILLFVYLYPLEWDWDRLKIFVSQPEEVSRFHLASSNHSFRAASTRVYNLTLAEEVLWPNGVQKTVLTINGLFPGPTIEVRSGDLLVVNVHNGLSEPTSLHWHGIRHPAGSNSQDGASGVTQCPIPAGADYTYRVQISPEQHGTFWYHSHYSYQRADGLFGALVVHAPASSDDSTRPHQDELRGVRSAKFKRDTRDDNSVVDQIMIVGDWYHRSGKQVTDWFQSLRSHGNEPVPDAVLNNGEQAFNCSKSLAKITCDPARGRTPTFTLHPQHRNVIRFINPGSIADIHLSFDSHLLRVFEADGTQIQPVTVKEVTIAPGQRYAVEVIRVDNSTLGKGRFWLRQRVNYEDFKYPNVALDLESKSILSYGRLGNVKSPRSTGWSDIKAEERFDALALQPLDPAARVLPPADDVVMMYVTTMIRTSTGNKPFGYVNQTTWKPSYSNPVLARTDVASSSKELIYSIKPRDTNASSSSIVLDIIVNNLEDGPHPFHLHGHHFWPLHTYEAPIGKGSYRWERPPTLPTTAPALRDTFVIPATGHAIFRVKFDTPGMWLFHCHVLVHLQAGMGLIFEVMGDRVPLEDRANAASSCTLANA
ncbi:hypothetical protein GYMLUDRAFT_48961 [Collybiopsis luxurians FD-317 M1]|uniref:laccase n=1 Tax=Collybiopsis luxurians FD-317 M1 TaxID=944289 RepID=A0A0D0C8A6_9AGAR|nr:hypothetical protein GYMLUDRAFT_48961 [Collybiopsis luxurians FD-317 M1]